MLVTKLIIRGNASVQLRAQTMVRRIIVIYLFLEVFLGISDPFIMTTMLLFSMTQQLRLIVQANSSSDLFIS